jgi:hypothetical protein
VGEFPTVLKSFYKTKTRAKNARVQEREYLHTTPPTPVLQHMACNGKIDALQSFHILTKPSIRSPHPSSQVASCGRAHHSPSIRKPQGLMQLPARRRLGLLSYRNLFLWLVLSLPPLDLHLPLTASFLI